MSALYRVLRSWCRLGLWLFAERIEVKNSSGRDVESETPAIIACNHPNSFLDAIIIAVVHPQPVHFLARGDVFRRPLAARLLRAINAIPIHRLSEGREHLHLNDSSFRECLEILKGGGSVLIFSEGLSEHSHTVRPLRKGTARLAWLAWQEEKMHRMIVQPVRISYQSFTNLPKRVSLSYAPALISDNNLPAETPAHFYKAFNQALSVQLNNCSHIVAQQPGRAFGILTKSLLAPFALTGFLLHMLYYFPMRQLARRNTRNSVFYDSVLFGLLLFTYPVYMGLVAVLAGAIGGWIWAVAALLLLPISAFVLKSFLAIRYS